MAPCSDGCIRHVSASCKKGEEFSDENIAVTKKGVRTIIRALPIIKEAAAVEEKLKKLKQKLNNIRTDESDIGCVRFVGTKDDDAYYNDDHNDVGVGVGCQFIRAADLPAVLKQLKIK